MLFNLMKLCGIPRGRSLSCMGASLMFCFVALVLFKASATMVTIAMLVGQSHTGRFVKTVPRLGV